MAIIMPMMKPIVNNINVVSIKKRKTLVAPSCESSRKQRGSRGGKMCAH